MSKLSVILVILVFSYTCSFGQFLWTEQVSPITDDIITCWAVDNNVCWMGGDNKVVKTTNGGDYWASVSWGLSGLTVTSIFAFDASKAWLGTDDALRYTVNGGTSWTYMDLSPHPFYINTIYFYNSNLGFIVADPTAPGGKWLYFITTNGGTNWILAPNAPYSSGTEFGYANSCSTTDTAHIWWGTGSSKIYKGSFRGHFTAVPTSGSQISTGVCFNNTSTGLACFSLGTNKISTDGGNSWNVGSFTPTESACGLRGVKNTSYFWLTTIGHIFGSTNSGASFTEQFTLPWYATESCVSMSSINCGWVGCSGGHIYKFNGYVGVSNQNNSPKQFTLKQNYPNPFNPTTTINYSVPKTSVVTIKVYDLVGHDVMTLVNQVKTAGNYNAYVDGKDLSSGIYIYRLTADGYTDSKKMILIK
jgi:hypothetical protein